jgi:SAM-dependent methyltransferase
MEQVTGNFIADVLPHRQHPQWSLAFALDYFHYPVEVVEFIAGQVGQQRLWDYWKKNGYQMYDEPLYAIRQEIYHTSLFMRRIPAFFDRLPEGTTVLDYGCGTAEMERLDWIDKGGKTILADCEGPNFEYVKAKYPHTPAVKINGTYPTGYGALICCHVFEHMENPIEALKELWDGLLPGGQALLWFDRSWPAPGHLIESIGHYPEYRAFLKKHAISVASLRQYDWVMKPKRRWSWGFSTS